MSLAMSVVAVVFLSIMAFWKFHSVIFMLAGGASMALGLYWYDLYTTDIGLSIGLMFIAYSFVCFGFAFKCIFWREYKIED